MKLKALFIAAPLMAASSLAFGAGGHGPAVEAEAWTPKTLRETLAAMPAGDIQRGKQAHDGLFCASCHGDTGLSPTRNYPHLAGQRAEYTYKMLVDYKAFRRDEGRGRAQIMVRLSQILTRQQMADLAVYYESLPLPEGNGEPKATPMLVSKGDSKRLLTPCASCHGVYGEGGKNETPAIAGQVKDYLMRTMHNFKQRARDNDTEEGMSQFVHELSEQEIEMLADYYAGLSKPD
ncbi:MAG: c-type cytochrome [Pseudomonadota bacterium]